ncbi:MAG TPA: TonB family protein [Steroidobacteraceae bacterium]|nr:TonB family protein [Steroidobacteraceae bacterium]
MAVELFNNLPDARVDRGDSLESMRALVPQRAVRSWLSQISGRAWFAAGTAAVHVLVFMGFLAAQKIEQTLAPPEPMEVSLIDTPATEKPPEYVPPPEQIVYSLPMPQDITVEVETITPPPPTPAISAIADPRPTVMAPPVVESVEYVRAPAPVYPAESSRRRERGTVVLRVLIDAEGRAAEIRVEQSSGFERLDVAARDAVRKALFRPYEVNGIAQPAQVLIPIEFTRRG